MTHFPLNSDGTAEIRVEGGEFKGKRHIGCRVWRKWPGVDELRPTKQGVNIPLDLAVEVGRAIVAAAEAGVDDADRIPRPTASESADGAS